MSHEFSIRPHLSGHSLLGQGNQSKTKEINPKEKKADLPIPQQIASACSRDNLNVNTSIGKDKAEPPIPQPTHT